MWFVSINILSLAGYSKNRHPFGLQLSADSFPAFEILEDFIPANKQDVYVLPGFIFSFVFCLKSEIRHPKFEIFSIHPWCLDPLSAEASAQAGGFPYRDDDCEIISYFFLFPFYFYLLPMPYTFIPYTS